MNSGGGGGGSSSSGGGHQQQHQQLMISPSINSASDLIDAKLEEHNLCGSKQCPGCGHKFDGKPDWVGLPAGVKFDPTDQELIEHLEAKAESRHNTSKSHPLIDEFIPTIRGEDGICYTHPERLPGVTRDGLSRHFFHRPSKAYTTGTRKRRKIQTELCDQLQAAAGGETRWHKTGKTRPVLVNGKQKGCKKILVLYTNFGKNRKPEKTNWVMHQYHLGQHEEEKEGELVVSKIFYQTQPRQCNWSSSSSSAENKGLIIAPPDQQGGVGTRGATGGSGSSTCSSSREMAAAAAAAAAAADPTAHNSSRDHHHHHQDPVLSAAVAAMSAYNHPIDHIQHCLKPAPPDHNFSAGSSGTFVTFTRGFDEGGGIQQEATTARETPPPLSGVASTCDDTLTLREQQRPPRHHMTPPHQQDHHPHHHHHHHQLATAAFHVSRPSPPISQIISPPPLHHASIILDDDPYHHHQQHIPRIINLQNDNFQQHQHQHQLHQQQQEAQNQQQHHKMVGRSAAGLEEIIMGCTSSSSDIKEEASITNQQDPDWLKYSTFWHDPEHPDPHG